MEKKFNNAGIEIVRKRGTRRHSEISVSQIMKVCVNQNKLFGLGPKDSGKPLKGFYPELQLAF